MRKFRFWQAAVVAFIMGVPMASEAKAGSGFDIFEAALALTFSIIDAAGDS
jgi:hypothetical protein